MAPTAWLKMLTPAFPMQGPRFAPLFLRNECKFCVVRAMCVCVCACVQCPQYVSMSFVADRLNLQAKKKSVSHCIPGIVVHIKGQLPCKVHFALTTIFILSQPVSEVPRKQEKSILLTILMYVCMEGCKQGVKCAIFWVSEVVRGCSTDLQWVFFFVFFIYKLEAVNTGLNTQFSLRLWCFPDN